MIDEYKNEKKQNSPRGAARVSRLFMGRLARGIASGEAVRDAVLQEGSNRRAKIDENMSAALITGSAIRDSALDDGRQMRAGLHEAMRTGFAGAENVRDEVFAQAPDFRQDFFNSEAKAIGLSPGASIRDIARAQVAIEAGLPPTATMDEIINVRMREKAEDAASFGSKSN